MTVEQSEKIDNFHVKGRVSRRHAVTETYHPKHIKYLTDLIANRDFDYFGYKKRTTLIIILKNDKRIVLCIQFHTARKLDIASGNHALRTQPTDFSLIWEQIIE